MLEKLANAHVGGSLRFFGALAHLADPKAFAALIAPLSKTKWFVYAKRPFAGPEAVLAYLSRYTHRVAISNRPLLKADDTGVTFACKDYRHEGRDRYRTMTLTTDEFIRRFLLHVLPSRFHRIRHYGLFANGARAGNLAKARRLLNAHLPNSEPVDTHHIDPDEPPAPARPCPCCGGRMIVIDTFEPGRAPRPPPPGWANAA